MSSPGSPATEPSVPLSALEHWAYCPRQAALILLEDAYAESADTVRGSLAHGRVDAGEATTASGVRELRALPVFSDRLGLHGVADLVEIAGGSVTPVEYKSGRYRPGGPADLQVVGQALCLEEMFGTVVETGFVLSIAERRRYPVPIVPTARAAAVRAASEVRQILAHLELPPPVDDSRCPRCSMLDVCLPRIVSSGRSILAAERVLFQLDPDP